jgi:DNA-binding SARP family transcriptional activator
MRFRLLGLLEVEDDEGLVRIVPGRESALLALLLVHRREPLSSDRIVEEVWGDAAPANATKSVQVYISRLRKSLGVGRIETTRAGYRIRLEPDEFDVEQFEELAEAGRTADALALWRGEPLAEFRYASFAQSEARRLEELHSRLLADRIDERIAAGRAAETIPELEALIAREPLWERPRAQLMHALYLVGRQADALELYRRTRTLLGDELGVDPGPELQQLERAILNQDRDLGTPAPPRRPLRRRGRLAVGAGLVLAATAAAAAIVVGRSGGSGVLAARGDALVGLDPDSGRILDVVSTGSRPSRVAVDGTSVWAVNAGDATITYFDARHPSETATFGAGSDPADLAATSGALWVGGGGRVTSFDPARHTPLQTAALPGSPAGPPQARPPEERRLVAGGGSVWAIGPDQAVVQLDARTGRVVRKTDVYATALAFGDGQLWAIDAGAPAVDRIDPTTGALARQVKIASLLTLGGLAVADGSVWVTSPFQSVVWRILLGPPVSLQTVPVAFGVGTIAAAHGSVWVGDNFDDGVYRIDTRADPPLAKRIATVPAPQDIAVTSDRVWVASGGSAARSGPVTGSACDPLVYGGPGKPDVLFVSDFDLEGPAAPYTAPMAHTVAAVLRSAHYRAGRFHVGLQSCDDASRAAHGLDIGQCTANASSYARDASVVGVVGLQSSCVVAELPILNRAPNGPVALISPTSTDPFLTRGAPSAGGPILEHLYGSGVRSYGRTIGADHLQVAADAELAHQLGIRRVGVVFNRDGLVSQAEEEWFRYAAARLPGMTAVPILWDGTSPLAPRLRRAHVDGAFLTGAVTEDNVSAVRELRRVLPAGRIVVSDWLAPFSSLKPAGRAAVGVYGTISGPMRLRDLTPDERRIFLTLPAGDRVPSVVGPTVDAARAMLAAIAASSGRRASVTRALLGHSGFDSGGDPRTAPVTVFRIDPAVRGPEPKVGISGGVVVRVLEPTPRLVEPAQRLQR